MYKNSKWAKKIISLQLPNGSWGYFHSLSEPKKYPITTEQALRRLTVLGYTLEDECIKKAVSYMIDCLTGGYEIPDRKEKTHNWDEFVNLMLATWIRRFTKDSTPANEIAEKWAKLISSAFSNGIYDHDSYIKNYHLIFNKKPKGGRIVDFVSFYQVSIIVDLLDENTEGRVFDYIINHQNGIYYMYDYPLTSLPQTFKSKQASRYLATVELMAKYKRSRDKLKFVVDWIYENVDEDGKWDMSLEAKDGVYFPLSDRWDEETRKLDCTYRIEKLIKEIGLEK